MAIGERWRACLFRATGVNNPAWLAIDDKPVSIASNQNAAPQPFCTERRIHADTHDSIPICKPLQIATDIRNLIVHLSSVFAFFLLQCSPRSALICASRQSRSNAPMKGVPTHCFLTPSAQRLVLRLVMLHASIPLAGMVVLVSV